MKEIIERRIALIKRISRGDPEYMNIKNEFIKSEINFHELLPQLTMEQQDQLWEFFNLSGELDRRLLEIACEYVNFNM